MADASRRWYALALVCLAQFMVILDVSIVNVALPSIQRDLGFSQEGLQWVITAYALVIGGFLLLGGRAADLYGRRRIFVAGLTIFSLASVACGLANSAEWLVIARGVQGFGAALLAPATLSIITTLFAEGAERNRAIGIWGAISGSGGAVGVLLGGVLTDFLSWEWIFYVNGPIGLLAIALTPLLIPESRVSGARGFDLVGALTATTSLMLLVYALTETRSAGWTSFQTIGLLALSAALLVAFVVIEMRIRQPLVPLRLFRLRTLSGANATGFLVAGSLFGMFFILSLYMQQVLGYSAMRAGVAYLAIALTIIVSAGIASQLVTKLGVKPVLVTGLTLATVGLLYFTQISPDGNYWGDLFPGFIVSGAGLGFAFVPMSIAAVAGVEEHETGIASGILNTSQQVGGALGVAIVTALMTNRGDSVMAAGERDPRVALTEGFQSGFIMEAAFAAVAVVVALVLIQRVKVPEGQPLPAGAGAG